MRVALRSKIIDLMEPMLKEAERTGKWLWCNYQDLWFSPAQLREHQAVGFMLWGPPNWSLRDPQERLQEAERRLQGAIANVERIRKEISKLI